jgi:V/A-type H+-transporting ATPase subunit K
LIQLRGKAVWLTLSATIFVIGLNLLRPAYAQAQGRPEIGLALVGAGVAIGLAGLGAGIGMGTAGAAAIGSIAEKPEMFSKTLIYIVFIEAIAIYGLVIAFMILNAPISMLT